MTSTRFPCDVCSGQLYVKEDGFYYCDRCQTQCATVREQLFEEEREKPKSRRILTKGTRPKPPKIHKEITSWECYNYILVGLTDQMVKLGAGEKYKDTVRTLWFKFLRASEVLHDDPTELPKLRANYSRCDAELIYNSCDGPAKKKRYKVTQSVKVKAVKCKKMALATYKKTMPNPGAKKKKLPVEFSQKTISFLQEHYPGILKNVEALRDVKLPYKYTAAPDVLNRTKLYAILYLALLINKEQIQLGDMRRFLYEGHLSYNSFDHFLPAEMSPRAINTHYMKRTAPVFPADNMREKVRKLSTFLGVDGLVPVQNLRGLCERYCTELNLPDELKDCIVGLMAATKPKMTLRESVAILPNYEARAVSFIIFVLKLLFGLDGATELQTFDGAFDFPEWLTHVCLRRFLISHHHFPASPSNKRYEKYIAFMKSTNDRPDDDNPFFKHIRQILQKFTESAAEVLDVPFRPSLTPSRDYLHELLKRGCIKDDCLLEILNKEFAESRIDHLFNIGVEHYGAENIRLVPMRRKDRNRTDREKFYNACAWARCRRSYRKTLGERNEEEDIDVRPLLKLFQENGKKMESTCRYNPDERFWLNTMLIDSSTTQDEFDGYFKSLPYTFQLVVEECAGVISQTPRELLVEYNLLETDLAYVLRAWYEGYLDTKEYVKVPKDKVRNRYESLW